MLISWGDVRDPSGERGLMDEITGSPINDATCRIVAVRDQSTGATLPGTAALAMSYLAASAGVYHATVPASVAVSLGQRLQAQVEAVSSGRTLTRYIEYTVVEA